ncbi:branched-chain amino acid ABC transporter permease [Pseudoclavibacter endophyticus]|uniref:Branched-chain amino acid ABC transporter permease n=1 Tax=Pseudoclavibacter endophyticus TaxID=1778590 RepID=A0A6H9WM49_9MICO|nr:branched-chain amino acid ABC transporter permease [Pseudoclavibacter endophyticus]KAB1648891.1 branched-chain amino acid ABC transporter permease [Pseudoclavibacter endophyticus]GGA67456.1 branched-chain amino acid ABC transporter permease [Pseudoclavibacter endophyticus]
MIEFLFSVLTQLGLYGLLALSLSLVFGASRVVNLAVGDFAAIGAFVVYATAGLPFGVSVLVAIVVSIPLLVAIERGLLARVLHSPLATLLITWGVGMLIRQTCEVIWGATPSSIAAPVEGSIEVFGITYPAYRLVVGVVAVLICVGVLAAIYGTRIGLRIRAVSDNSPMASLLGVPPAATRTLVFVIAGMLAVLAGALYAPILGVYPSLGFNLLLPAFVALLLAQPGSFRGAAIAALLVVVVQIVLRRFFPDTVADTIFFAAVLIVISVRSLPLIGKARSWFTRLFTAHAPSSAPSASSPRA